MAPFGSGINPAGKETCWSLKLEQDRWSLQIEHFGIGSIYMSVVSLALPRLGVALCAHHLPLRALSPIGGTASRAHIRASENSANGVIMSLVCAAGPPPGQDRMCHSVIVTCACRSEAGARRCRSPAGDCLPSSPLWKQASKHLY